MSEFKTLGDFAKESGITLARVTKLLDGITPVVQVGRTKGFHPDALRAALMVKFEAEMNYLGVGGYAQNIAVAMTGEGN